MVNLLPIRIDIDIAEIEYDISWTTKYQELCLSFDYSFQ